MNNNHNMVEIAKLKSSASEDDEQPRVRVSSKARRKLEIIELKMKIENVEEEEKKIHFLLKEMGEEGLEWFLDLGSNHHNWNRIKQEAIVFWESKENQKLELEEKERIEKMLEKKIDETVKEKIKEFGQRFDNSRRYKKVNYKDVKYENENMEKKKLNAINVGRL
ncbi:hypothetical protein COBT_001639, partial [Conglomerata obtusa]